MKPEIGGDKGAAKRIHAKHGQLAERQVARHNVKGRRKLLIIIPILIYFLYFFAMQQIKIFELQGKIREKQKEIKVVQTKLGDLAEEDIDVSSKKYIEKQARQQSDLVYPNEIIYELSE